MVIIVLPFLLTLFSFLFKSTFSGYSRTLCTTSRQQRCPENTKPYTDHGPWRSDQKRFSTLHFLPATTPSDPITMAKSKHSVLPLVLLLLFVAVLAVVGYVVYTIVQDVSKNTREKMEKKHMVFTKDGMKVQVKEVQDEAYKDRTQRCVLLSRWVGLETNRIRSVLVNMWNHTSFPAYKSRLWDMTGEQKNAEKRKPYVI